MADADESTIDHPRVIDLSGTSPGKFPVLSPEAAAVARQHGISFHVMSGEEMQTLIETAAACQLDLVRSLAGMVDEYVEMFAASIDPTGHPIH